MMNRTRALVKDLADLKEAFSKQYWYCHPTKEGADIPCYLCGMNGSKHIESQNGYLCPVQPSAKQQKGGGE